MRGRFNSHIVEKEGGFYYSSLGISKNYLFQVHFHVMGFSRPKQILFPEHIVLTPASENDLNGFKQNWCDIPERTFFGDKIYHNSDFLNDLAIQRNSVMLTPVKRVKNQQESYTKRQSS